MRLSSETHFRVCVVLTECKNERLVILGHTSAVRGEDDLPLVTTDIMLRR